MYRGFGNMPFNMLGVCLIPIILIVIIGVSIYRIGKNKKEDSKVTNNSALNILDERFAKGEIDEEEYSRKKRNINI